MSRVFEWKEIEDSRVPSLASIETIAMRVGGAFEACSGIFGGIIYGSFITQEYNHRSALNCLGVYDASERLDVMDMLRELHVRAAALNVPLECILVSHANARDGLHSLTPSFLNYLGRVATREHIKQNCLAFFKVPKMSRKKEVRAYLSRKVEKLLHGFCRLSNAPEPQQCHILGKAMSAHIGIMRQMLWWQSGVVPEGDSMTSIRSRFYQGATTQERKLLDKISAANFAYNEELGRQMEWPHAKDYSGVFKNLCGVVPSSLEFAELQLECLR